MFNSSGRGCGSAAGWQYSPLQATGLPAGEPVGHPLPSQLTAHRSLVSTEAKSKTSKSKCCGWSRRCSMPHVSFFFLFSLSLRNIQGLNSRQHWAREREPAQALCCLVQGVSWMDSGSKFSETVMMSSWRGGEKDFILLILIYCVPSAAGGFYTNHTTLLSSLLAIQCH